MRRPEPIIAIIALAASVAGCVTTEPTTTTTPDASTAVTSTAVTLPPGGETVLGRSVEGRPIAHDVVLGDGGRGDVALIIASIHGDEGAGTPLVHRLRDTLRETPMAGRTVVLVPVANPDGLARGTRRNANGRDLNRDFPSTNRRSGPVDPGDFETQLEPETRVLVTLVERYRPAVIVSIHQPLACIDYDGPAAALARAMARAGALPVRKLGARPGSLGSWAGVDLGIPVITLELPGAASRLSDDELWARYGTTLLTAIGATQPPTR